MVLSTHIGKYMGKNPHLGSSWVSDCEVSRHRDTLTSSSQLASDKVSYVFLKWQLKPPASIEFQGGGQGCL